MKEGPLQLDVPCTWFNVRRASRAITQHFDRILQPSGLRVTQLSILYSLQLTGPAMVTRIAEMLCMDRTTLTRNLKPLEKLGLIKTVNGKDKRTRILKLTLRGDNKISQAAPLWKKANAHFVDGLGFSDWNSLIKFLSSTVALVREPA